MKSHLQLPNAFLAITLLATQVTATAIAQDQPAAQHADVASKSIQRLSDEQLLTETQELTFRYFYDAAEPVSGLTRERLHLDNRELDKDVVTVGGTGFGLMAMLVGIEREFVSREAGVRHLQKMLNSLESADRYQGVWPHWLIGPTGKTKPFSPKDDGADLVETSFLAQGLICVRQYFQDGTSQEQQLARQADRLWKQINWTWFQGPDSEDVLYWHWSPRHHWAMNFKIRGYNECLITYVLAASSPTHPVPPSVYHNGWADKGNILKKTSAYGQSLNLKHQGIDRYCGPLFWAHYSFLGLNPMGLKDKYANYGKENTSHVLMQRAYCIDNPMKRTGFSEHCWGLTSSYSLKGYRGHRPGSEEGTISPTAALSSFPYAPKECMQALRHFKEELGEHLLGPYGYYDAFNLEQDWFPKRYLAIDQGPIIVMIENHRTKLLWNLFMSAEEVQAGLKTLEFQTPQ